VVVPPKTNAFRFRPDLHAGSDEGAPGDEGAPATARLYVAYLRAVDGGWEGGGGFPAWAVSPAGVAAAGGAPPRALGSDDDASRDDDEDATIVPQGAGGEAIGASLPNASPDAGGRALRLAGAATSVTSVESLLATLEGMGVVNARVEVEAGLAAGSGPLPGAPPRDEAHVELPAGDGSCLPWAVCVQRVGVVECEGGGATSAPRVARGAFALARGAALAAFTPAPTLTLSAGVSCDDAPIVGRQWAAWAPDAGDGHFRWQLAPARPFVCSAAALLDARLGSGLYRAGALGTLLIADGDNWADARRLRFPDDEPARRAGAAALAALALLAAPGGVGTPDAGHVLAFNADYGLLLELVGALADGVERVPVAARVAEAAAGEGGDGAAAEV
jgi:UDP-3-O-acyl-N-acetylglucosamine deacetylase